VDRSFFSLVTSWCRYLPESGFLPKPTQSFEIRRQGRGGIKTVGNLRKTDQQIAQANVEEGIRMARSMFKKLHDALAKIKDGFAGPKHKHNDKKAIRLSIDVECEDKRIQVKYSKRWQKMKRRPIREFRLKWKGWALFIRNEETSDWVKLQPPYESLTRGASYRVVARPAARDKRPRPGRGRRWERRHEEEKAEPRIEQRLEWSATDIRPSSLERADTLMAPDEAPLNGNPTEEVTQEKITISVHSTIVVQRRAPSPPLRLEKCDPIEEKAWVDLVFAGQ
jgi:hypothetical protein